jgi:hypothetical protein
VAIVTPLVSIVIPVGPAHRAHVGTAIASCLWQTFQGWEAIVVNDTGAPIGHYADPRIRVIEPPRRPGLRPAIARNAGIAAARGTFTLQLDADDYLLPDALAVLLRGHAEHNRAYTYGLHYGMRGDGRPIVDSVGRPVINGHGVSYDAWDFTQANLHAVSALVPTQAWRDVGGFDEGAAGWDDWTGYARLRKAGYCGGEIRQPVFVYRIYLSNQHHQDNTGGLELQERVRRRIIGEGWEPMGCGCGGGAAAAKQAAQQAILGGFVPEQMGAYMAKGHRVLEYIGPGQGSVSIKGQVSKRMYRVGNNATNRYLSTAHTLAPEDIPALLGMAHLFKEVAPPPAYAEPPAPVEPESKADVAHVPADNAEADDDGLEMDASGIARPTARRRGRARGEDKEAA